MYCGLVSQPPDLAAESVLLSSTSNASREGWVVMCPNVGCRTFELSCVRPSCRIAALVEHLKLLSMFIHFLVEYMIYVFLYKVVYKLRIAPCIVATVC